MIKLLLTWYLITNLLTWLLAFVDSATAPQSSAQLSIRVSGDDRQLKRIAIANSVKRTFVKLSWVVIREKRVSPDG